MKPFALLFHKLVALVVVWPPACRLFHVTLSPTGILNVDGLKVNWDVPLTTWFTPAEVEMAWLEKTMATAKPRN